VTSERESGTGTGTKNVVGGDRGLRGPKALAVFGAVTALGTAVDLFSKHVAFTRIGPPPARVPVIAGFLDLCRSENPGAAFGILGGAFTFFVTVSILAILILSYFSFSAVRSGPGYQITLGLVASGVLGNLYDRLTFGVVRDFIDVYVSFEPARSWLRENLRTNHWPTFNAADAFICVGTGFLLVKFWRDEKAAKRTALEQAKRVG
jgi:signal peptidase II